MTNGHDDIDTYDTDHHHIDARVRAAFEAETSGAVASGALLERIHREVAEAPADGRSARHGVWAAAAAVVVLVAALGAVSMGDDGGAPVVADLADGSTMAPSPAVAGPLVSLVATGIEPLVATTSELAPPETGWLEHTITITNDGDEAIDLQAPAGTTLLADDLIITPVGAVCGDPVPAVLDEPDGFEDTGSTPPCTPPLHRLEPGDSHELRLMLQPAGDVTGNSSTLIVPIVWATWSSDQADPTSRHRGEIVVTYTGLSAATSADPVTTDPPATTTSLPSNPTTTLAVDADLTRIEGTYTGTSDYTFGIDDCTEQDHPVELDVTLDGGGRATYAAQLCAHNADDIWTGTGAFTLTMPDGGELTGDVANTAPMPTDGVPYTLTVTGGTGRFEGASGTCDVTVSVQDLGGGQTQAGSISCDVAQP